MQTIEGEQRLTAGKVLIVSQYFWPESFRINDLALGLRDSGYRVEVLTGKPNYPTGSFFPGYGYWSPLHDDYEGIPVARVPMVPRGSGSRAWLAVNYLSFALSASALGPFLCRHRHDVIFVYEPSPITVGLPAIACKKLWGVPIVFWVQDLWPESLFATDAVRSLAVLRTVRMLAKCIYRHCDLILVPSEGFRSHIEALGVDSNRILYFPNSAEALYQPMTVASNAPECAVLPDGFRVMFAGNVGVAQDFATILEAAERLRSKQDIHWIILGDGRMFTWVQEQVERRGLTSNVHLLGRYPMEVMPKFFSLADVMLMTLKKQPIFALTIPAKLQSYMACGKPVIAAIEGEGARTVSDAKAGLTPPPEDADALADAVLTMYGMTVAQRTEMGMEARRYFERHFEREMLLQRLDRWVRDLIRKCRDTPKV
ncbi:MAG: glycosyltransferase family 4 protein [Chromatiales bacterium]